MNVGPAAIASFFTGGYGLDLAIADRLDRLRILGNGVHPAQAEWAFRQLIARSVTK